MSAVRELQRCGYLQIERLRGTGGRFVSTTWIIKDPADRAPGGAPSRVAGEQRRAQLRSSDSRREEHSRPKSSEPGSDHKRHSRIVESDHEGHSRTVASDQERENRVLAIPSSTTEASVQNISTTTASDTAAVPLGLHFQGGLQEGERAEMSKMVRKYPLELAQQLLDEVADYSDTEIKSSRVGLLASLAAKAERGEFRFARGAAVAKRRDAKREDAARQAVVALALQVKKARASQPPTAAVLACIERGKEIVGWRS